jgi:flavocytochrome c
MAGATHVIVIGGGLAGLSAAHTVLEQGLKVTVIDKSAFFGGNSTKATSGINGAGTRSQKDLKIEDSAEVFEQDTKRGGASREDLIKVLTHQSASGVEWLMDSFKLDLSLVSRMGGHSNPRTHRGKEKFPGMTITYGLMEKLEDIADEDEEKGGDRARILLKSTCKELICKDGAVVGVKYEKNGEMFEEYGPVIISTGGFGADFGDDSLLKKFRPDLLHLPTTNGEHCSGDGLKMAMAIGADTVDLEWVQVHPTGMIHPEEPDAKVKFLAAEALRGVGGILLDADGNRFCNELGRRDYVTGMMWKNKGVKLGNTTGFFLCLNKKAATEMNWHAKHYMGRGLMKFYKSLADLAKEYGFDVKNTEAAFKEYNANAEKQAKDPDNGPYEAYGGGKAWDKWGKKFYHNGPMEVNDEYHVAIVTPVIHYCMGGIQMNDGAECLNKDGQVIPGLFVAGEAMGGVHGTNRLGGNSLLDCVVFGRVSGRSAARYVTKANAGLGQKTGQIAAKL